MGVRRSTATKIVSRLIDAGTVRLVVEPVDNGPRAIGRPGQDIEFEPDHMQFLGAEVGIGFVRALRMDLAGEIRFSAEEHLPVAEQSPKLTAQACVRLLSKCAAGSEHLGGVAIAIPGIIRRDGLVVRAPKLGWRNVPFGDLIRPDLADFGPLTLENDANAFAMGEMIRSGVGEREFALFVHINTGIGGAIVDRGKFLLGEAGLAGEIGHMYVHRCGMGADWPTERLEEIAGTNALVDRCRCLEGNCDSLDAFIHALDAGDKAAERAKQEWVSAMAQALASLTSVLNPGCILIGGEMAGLASRFRIQLSDMLRDLTMHGTPIPEIAVSQTAENTVALGCAEIQRLAYLEGRSVEMT